MALVYSDLQTTVNGPASGMPPATRIKANKLNGRIRFFEATYTAPASSPPAIGDKIIWGKLPQKARIIGHLSKLYWGNGAASCTLNLGDNVLGSRHMPGTSVTTAGSAVLEAQAANGAVFETSDDTNSVANGFLSTTDDCTLVSTVFSAAIAVNQVFTLKVAYVTD